MDVETGAIGSLLPKLRKLLEEEHILSEGVKKGIQFVIDELLRMHFELRRLAKVPPYQLDEWIKGWAREARKLSYRIEDSVDRSLNFQDRPDVSLVLGDFKAALMNVNWRRQKRYVLSKVFASRAATYDVDPPRASLYGHEAELIGAEEARDELIKMLTEGDNHQMKIVVSIVGFGGLGKTSLAFLVYRELKSKFDRGAFVSVSPNPDMKEIFKSILCQLDAEKHANIHDEAWHERQLNVLIRELLRNKRYLIVIDGLWDANVWYSIRRTLPNNDYGSRVITTTRVNDIAKQCCSGHDELIYEMKPLGYQNSKILFLKRIFGSEVSCPDALTEVIDEILKMCGGMPLAIISIASLLRKVTTEESPHKDSRLDLEDLTNSLSLSYFHLPSSTLKTCLLYLATSAENQRIKRDNLVRKWIAEGFISEDGGDSREEKANRYFDELINRNVIRPVEYGNCPPGEKIYEIHYLMLYTLRMISEEKHFVTFFTDVGISGPHQNPSYLLFIQCSDSGRSIDAARMDLSHVRSITTLGPAKLVSFKNLGYIRVLDLDGCEDLDNTDVNDICRMILLRYLSLKQTPVTELPPEIGNLLYLETLDVRQTQITELPPEIGKLPHLKTLCVRQTQITNLPAEIGNLLYLEIIDVRQTQITELPPQIGELQNLETLDVGQTQITELPPQIGKLQNLETLDVGQTQITELPPEIGKLPHLKTLCVRQTQITNLPVEIGNLLYLEIMDVRQTQINELPPQIGKLQNLETLDVRQTQLRELPKEVVQLPKLARLHFGQSSSIGGVKLPAGSNHLKSVKVLGAVDSRECSASVMQEISELTEVRELTVVLYDGPADKQQNDKLLSSIGRCRNLESLTIYGDSNPSDKLPVSPEFPQLRKLKVAGRFVKVPRWISQLKTLTLLDIRVCKLEPNDLTILGDLPCLINLALVLVCLPREQIVITSSARFLNLEVFTFDCRLPWVTFVLGAMPRLEHLELKLYAGPAGKSPSGIVSLQRLKKVILRYASQYASSVRVTETVDVMRKEAGSHANLIKLYVNGVEETFPSNASVDRRISGNEIEE